MLIEPHSDPDSPTGQDPGGTDERLQSKSLKKGRDFLFQVAPVGVEILSGLRLLPGFPRE